MGGVQRNWDRSSRYGRKGRSVGGVHDMTDAERQAMFSTHGRTATDEDERVARIAAIRARRHAS